MVKIRRKFLCMDCRRDTGKMHEHYFLRTEIWLQAAPSIKGMLCLEHVEQRLGRRLVPSDFTKATINNPKYEPKSIELMKRIGK